MDEPAACSACQLGCEMMSGGVGRGLGFGFGFGFGFGGGAPASDPASGVVGGGTIVGIGGGYTSAGAHVTVEWHSSHFVEKVSWSGNVAWSYSG